MMTIFRYRLVRFRGQILGWGIALALLGLMLMQFYGTIVDQQEQLETLIQSYPEEFMAFFGDFESFATPSGYLSVEFFSYMPLILGVFAVLIGSGLLAGDEESGRLDLVMAHPVSRTALYWGRLAAFTVATAVILLIVWIAFAVSAGLGAMDVSALALLWPFVSLFGILMLFGALGLLFSLVLPSRRMAAMASGLLLVASFFLDGLARINADLERVAEFSPMRYYQGGRAIDGLNITWLAGLLVAAVLFALLAWWRFQARDIRVAGEGGWQRPTLSTLKRRLSRQGLEDEKARPAERAAARR